MSHGNPRTHEGSQNQSSFLLISFKEHMQRQEHENITGKWVEVEGLFASGELGVQHTFIQREGSWDKVSVYRKWIYLPGSRHLFSPKLRALDFLLVGLCPQGNLGIPWLEALNTRINYPLRVLILKLGFHLLPGWNPQLKWSFSSGNWDNTIFLIPALLAYVIF